MKDEYFTHHYSHINKIDPLSDDSVRKWLHVSLGGYEREIGQYLSNISNAKILELGCGIGGTIHYLKNRGAKNIIGVDHSADQLLICKKYVTNDVVQSDVFDFFQHSKEQFDYILALDLIEHLPKSRIIEFCSLLFNSLNNNGKVILRTPNMGSLFGLHSRYIDFTHEIGFTEESIQQVLRAGGFSDFEVHNAYIGRRRLLAVKIYQRMLEKLYNVVLSNIFTKNMIIVCQK